MKRQLSFVGLALGATLLATSAASVDDGYGKKDKGYGEKKDAVEWNDEARAKLGELFTKALDDAKNEVVYECNGKCETEGSSACPAASAPRVLLTRMVVKSPYGLEEVKPLVMEAMSNKSTGQHEANLVFELLMETRNPVAGEVAEEIYAESPKHFDGEVLLSFCEMGSKKLVDPLARAVKAGEGGVPAATFMAMKGDKVGARTLKKALATKEVTLANASDILLAGIGLDQLGKDEALHIARMKIHDATIDALDEGELDIARSLAVTASVCSSLGERKQASLSWIDATCAEVEAKATAHGELESAKDIFALIQKVTPITG